MITYLFRSFVLGALLCTMSSAYANSFIPSDGFSLPSLPEFTLPSSTDTQTVIELDIPGIYSNEIFRQGQYWNTVSIPGAGALLDEGKPALPMIGQFVQIPNGADVSIEILETSWITYQDYHIFPAQPSPIDNAENPQEAPWTLDEVTYQTNQFYPAEVATIEEPVVIRGQSMVMLRVFPVQFNPVSRELSVISKIKIRLNHVNGQYSYDPRLYTKAFQKLFKRMTLAPETGLFNAPAVASDDGNLFLIITAPEFEEAAQTLKTWKEQKGIETIVVTTATTGTTVTAIQSYLQNAYDNWEVPPTNLLLFGDAEFIPTHYVLEYEYGDGHIGSDIYYASLDGTDDMPDIGYARMPVDTLEQANRWVNRLIQYEKNPVTDSNYYNTLSVAAQFQDNEPENASDGMADRRFAQTIEDVAIYLSDNQYLGQYQVDRLYGYTDTNSPQFWDDYNWGFTSCSYAGCNGDAIPSNISPNSGFRWNTSATDITNSLEEGRFLIIHRDHGSKTTWGTPNYKVSHIQQLTNNDKLPVVWSINCSTGWWDDETDDSGYGTTVSFAETFLRSSAGGAVGVLAATRNSNSFSNNFAVYGWVDAVWPGFDSDFYGTHIGFPNEPIYEMGQVLNYGKYYFHSHVNYRANLDKYHWLGDPTMQLWTAEPQPMTVSHPQLIGNIQQIDVTTSIDGALIAVSKNGELLAKADSVANTPVTLTLPSAVLSGEKLDIVVTRHNYRTYTGQASTPVACIEYESTLSEHESAGRAWSQTVTEGQTCYFGFCFGGTEVTTWYATGSDENLGTSGSATVTLIETSDNYFETGSCPESTPPVIDNIQVDVTGTTAVISGTASDIDGDLTTIEVELDNSGSWVVAQGTDYWSITFSDLSAGDHMVRARALDLSANTSDPENASFSVIEYLPPEVTSWGYSVNRQTLTAVGTASDINDDLTQVRLYLGGGADVSCTGTHNFVCVAPNLPVNTYTVALKAIDATGLISEAAGIEEITIYEDTAPEVRADHTIVSNGILSVTGTVSDINGDLTQLIITAGDNSAECSTTANFTCEIDVSSMEPDTMHLAELKAIDSVGLEAIAMAPFNFTYHAPTIDSISEPNIKGTSVDITGTASDLDDDLVEVTLIGSGGTKNCNTTSEGLFLCKITNLSHGSDYTYQLQAVDARGLTATSDDIQIHIGQPPVIVSLTASPVDQTVSISGNASDADSDITLIEVEIDGQWYNASGLSSFTFNQSGLSIGSHQVRARATDSQTNTSVIYGPVSFEIEGPTCEDWSATLSQHESANRAWSETTMEGQTCWGSFCFGGTEVTTWYATGSDQELGTNGSAIVSLIEEPAESGIFVQGECPVDPQPPVITSYQIDRLNYYTLRVTGTASDPDDDLDRVAMGIGIVTGITCQGTTNFVCEINIDSEVELPVGEPIMFSLVAYDALDNRSTVIDFAVTRPQPSAPEITSADAQTSGYNAVISAVVEDTDDDITSVTLNDGTSCVEQSSNWTCSVTGLAEGTYNYQVTAYDAQGLISNTVIVEFSIVGGSAPEITSMSYSVNGDTLTVTGTAADADNDLRSVVLLGFYMPADCEGTETFTCTVSGLAEGNYSLQGVQAIDWEDNRSAIEGPVEFTIPPANECYTDTVGNHRSAGRAELRYGVLYYAIGSNDYLGNSASAVKSLQLEGGNWELVNSCQ